MAKTRLLIVEDEAVIAMQMEAQLTQLGYHVVGTATTGAEALTLIEANRPDLVLMDIRLQGVVDGITITGEIRTRFDIPVIYLTAYGDADTLRRAQTTAPFGYLLKPFRAHELHATIEMALYRHRMERELRRSQAQYERVVQHIKEALIVVDNHEQIVYANDEFLALFGLAREQLAMLVVEQLLASAYRETWRAQQQDMKLTRTEFVCEGVRRDGSPFWIEVTLVPIYEDGQRVGIQAVMRDITARKIAEDALYEQTRRLRVLHAIGRAILAEQSLAAISEGVLQHLWDLVPSCYTGVLLFEQPAIHATVLAMTVRGEDRSLLRLPLSTEVLLVLGTIQQGELYLQNDLAMVTSVEPTAQELVNAGLRSLLVVPLLAQGALIGALELADDQPYAFEPNHIAILLQVADMLAVAMHHACLFAQVVEGRHRLQTLSGQLIDAQERERRTLARELHDEIGQALTAIKINLQVVQGLQAAHPLPDLAQAVAESISIVDQTLQRVRDSSVDLRPAVLDDLGLVAALRWYLDRQQQRTRLAIQLTTELAEPRLSPELEITCFRIVQEALTNVARHAAAQHVQVLLRQQGTTLQLTIHDDGVGFLVAEALEEALHGTSAGLLGMQERTILLGGQFAIESTPGNGTTIRAHFPYQPALE